MDFAFTEEQEEIRGLAARICSEQVTHDRLKALEAESDTVFDRDLWRHLAESGLLALAVPADHGGSGLGLVETGLLLEELGKAVAPVPAVPTLVWGAQTLARHGTQAQQERWLPGVADGSVILTAALAEPGETDPVAPATRARPEGEGFRLTGEKAFVPYAQHADAILVPATTEDGTILVLVDPRAEGVRLSELVPTNREPQALLELDGVAVTAENIVAGPADGAAAVTDLVTIGTAALCCVQAGVCEAALRMTATYTSNREQFGKPIASFQAVGQRAADAYADTELVRLTAYQAIWRLAQAGGSRGAQAPPSEWPARNEVAVAKFWAADGGMRALHACQHLHGGIGVDLDYPLHRYFLWTKQIEHTLGTATRQLLVLGAALADEPV